MRTKILVVDDIEANRYSLNALFEEYLEDVDTILASGGEEALEITFDQHIDLIILDIQMPGIDGFETAKFLKASPKTKDIPIIFLTAAFKKEEFRKKGFQLGAIDYLTKPIENDQLVNKLKLYIELFAKKKEIEDKEDMLIAQSRYSAMSEMTSMIAHQWRQPLSSIGMLASSMQLELELGEFENDKFIHECENIGKKTQLLSEIINNFAYFYQTEESIIKILINDTLNDVYNMVAPSLEEYNIKLEKDFQSKKEVTVYRQELKQVVMSIVRNALEISSFRNIKKAIITLKSWDDDKHIYFSICDNAGGIDDAIFDKIYNPYFSTKEEKNAVGLGLYMTKAIIEKHHNGSIKSYNENGGACFVVKIPFSGAKK